MGYRSEVSLVLTRNAFAELCKTIPNHLNTMINYSDMFMQKGNSFYLKWDHIKWYKEYSEIAALTNAFNELDSDEYHFLRIGENNDDIEEGGGYWDNPFGTYISRSISVDTSDSTEVDLSLFM